jgi:hypothetical protein
MRPVAPQVTTYQPVSPNAVDLQPPKPSASPANMVFAVDAAFILGNNEGIGPGLGFAALFEKKLAKRIAITGRGALVFHPSNEQGDVVESTVSANEGLIFIGARTRSKLPLYLSFEAGTVFFTRRETIAMTGIENTSSHTYPGVMLGGGVRIGKVHFEAYLLAVASSGDYDIPARFFATFGVDLFKR